MPFVTSQRAVDLCAVSEWKERMDSPLIPGGLTNRMAIAPKKFQGEFLKYLPRSVYNVLQKTEAKNKGVT